MRVWQLAIANARPLENGTSALAQRFTVRSAVIKANELSPVMLQNSRTFTPDRLGGGNTEESLHQSFARTG